ncbi:MAG: IS66 family transposase, partial [Bacilli bacterium]
MLLPIQYTSGKDEVPFTLYDYQSSRSGVHASSFLTNFSGYLHCDGYAGYNGI